MSAFRWRGHQRDWVAVYEFTAADLEWLASCVPSNDGAYQEFLDDAAEIHARADHIGGGGDL